MSQEEILNILPKDPENGLTSREIAAQLEKNVGTTRYELGRLKKFGFVECARFMGDRMGSKAVWWRIFY